MKLIIVLAVVAWSNAAKLDRTYLPPSYAQTSGGNANFLQTPVSGSLQYQNNFGQNNGVTGATTSGFAQNNNYPQSGNYAQNGNGFAQNDYQQNNNEYSQDNNNYAQSDDAFPQNDFAQNGNAFAQNGNGFNNFEARPERPQASFERNAAILRQDNSNDGETYSYAYETENGIIAEENGVATNGVEAQGGYSYTGDDGQVYSVRYTADQNGFVPQGDHLPTPPPIPEEILKALEQNAQDEANGIFDDGTYNEAKYENGDSAQLNDNYANNENGYNYNNENGNKFNAGGDFNGNSNNENSFIAGGIANDDDSVVTNNALLRSSSGAFGSNNQNGVEKAYLPPFERNGQRNQAGANRRYNQVSNGFRNQASNGFGNQAATGFSNQASNGFNNQNGVEKAYLPPEQFGQRTQNGANGRYNNQRNGGLRNQAPKGVEKAYLPPFERNQNASPSRPIYDEPQNFANQGQRNQPGFGSRNPASREYLPPSANRRTNGRNGSGRRPPSFSAKNGYEY